MIVIIVLCLTASVISEHFFNTPQYFSKSAKEKSDLLYSEIAKNFTPQGYFGDFKTAGMLLQNNWPTMNWEGDVLPEGRDKLIHSDGVVAECEVNFNADSGYSGLLSSQNKHAFIRMSAASKFDTSKDTPEGAYDNFTPGFGLKVLVDGKRSENLVAMYDTVKQSSWDFFEHNFSNMFNIDKDTPLKKALVARAFTKVTDYVSSVGIREWAQVNPDGSKVNDKDVKFPFQLFFVPTKEVKGLFKRYYTIDYKNLLAAISNGTIIYDIFATDKPGCQPAFIGNIKLKTHFVTSEFADRKLFFRHGLINYDDSHEAHAEFNKHRDSYGFFGRYEKEDPKGKFKCPFAS